jgi:hypothetical protein
LAYALLEHGRCPQPTYCWSFARWNGWRLRTSIPEEQFGLTKGTA